MAGIAVGIAVFVTQAMAADTLAAGQRVGKIGSASI
jgi:hypothetical protein